MEDSSLLAISRHAFNVDHSISANLCHISNDISPSFANWRSTDPILAAAIVRGTLAEKNIPQRLRQTISAESSANDGLAVPFIFSHQTCRSTS